MASTDNGEDSVGGEESSVGKVGSHAPLHISTSQSGVVTDENSENGCTNGPSALPRRPSFLKLSNLSSASVRFQRMAEGKDEVSRAVPSFSSSHIRERLQRLFSQKMDWNNLWEMFKKWIREPVNIALFIWMACVAVSGAILFMVMVGMLNRALPSKSQRNAWFEVNNQIINALFTLMCLYQHPKRILHLVLLVRWRTEDVLKLRKIYCKNGTYKPHEWAHMMVVVVLLHVNCFAQYASCGINLGYRRSERPPIAIGITISFAIAAPAIAGVYAMLSPLGKDYEPEIDEESQTTTISTDGSNRPDLLRRRSLQKRFSFALMDEEKTAETRPQWSGGILDFWDDISLAYLSLFCSFCVFGWNMERLGFGNMYVHIATFLLFCLAPFWIFNLAAVNIDNETVRAALGVTGIFLCVFGLLYGGFWRIQMRKRFNLPSYNFCCGKPALADFALWLFCCWCSLAQEVRTGNSYNIVEDKFCEKEDEILSTSPLAREDGEFQCRPSTPSSPFQNSLSPSQTTNANSSISLRNEEQLNVKDETMTPPSPSVIRKDEI